MTHTEIVVLKMNVWINGKRVKIDLDKKLGEMFVEYVITPEDYDDLYLENNEVELKKIIIKYLQDFLSSDESKRYDTYFDFLTKSKVINNILLDKIYIEMRNLNIEKRNLELELNNKTHEIDRLNYQLEKKGDA